MLDAGSFLGPIQSKSSCPALYSFQSVDVFLCCRVPHSAWVFVDGARSKRYKRLHRHTGARTHDYTVNIYKPTTWRSLGRRGSAREVDTWQAFGLGKRNVCASALVTKLEAPSYCRRTSNKISHHFVRVALCDSKPREGTLTSTRIKLNLYPLS